MAVSGSWVALQDTDLITSHRRKPGLRKAKDNTVGGVSFLIRKCEVESPPNSPWEGIKAVNSVGIAS